MLPFRQLGVEIGQYEKKFNFLRGILSTIMSCINCNLGLYSGYHSTLLRLFGIKLHITPSRHFEVKKYQEFFFWRNPSTIL